MKLVLASNNAHKLIELQALMLSLNVELIPQGALGISEAEAQTLAAGGMNSIEVILTSGADDIAGLLGCDLERGQKILDAARASVQPQETAAS